MSARLCSRLVLCRGLLSSGYRELLVTSRWLRECIPGGDGFPDITHLRSVLGRAFPGATEGPFALDRYADVDDHPKDLVRGEFMWDCDNDCDDYDY